MPDQQPSTKPAGTLFRIVVVDPRASACDELQASLAGSDGLHISACATAPDDAVFAVRERKPDLVIADGGDASALELVQRLSTGEERVSVLVLKRSDGNPSQDLLRTVVAVVNASGDGEAPPSPRDGASASVSSLSPRELQAFELMGRGLVTPVIAKQMEVSPKTVETYRARIKHKLGLTTYTELIQRAATWMIDRR